MLVLAHRGYHAEHSENTLAAFDAAVHLGVDGIETDVQVTSEGTPILFHDTTIQGRPVAALTHAELCRLSGREVPTLVSALDAWPDVFWNLEIKTPTHLPPIWPVVQRHQNKRCLLVSSFRHPVAVLFGRSLGLDCGLLVAHCPLTFQSLLVGLPRDLPHHRVAIVWECNEVEELLVEAARASGIKSYVYGPQTPADHARLAAWNVDGIITDHPELSLIK